MEVKNLNYLKDTLKYLGFGDKLNSELESKMKMVEKEFTLTISTEMQKDKVSATLHFKKGNDTDIYFFNKYDAKLEKPGLPARENTFYVDKGKGFTMKEAYNLLDGRAVHKEFKNQEGDKYKAWRQFDLDFKDKNNNFEVKQYTQKYGYDVRDAMSYYPIREFLKDDDRANLAKSLERGNLQTVTLDVDGLKQQYQIAADPKNRGLVFSDMEGKILSKSEKEGMMLKPEIREEMIEKLHEPKNVAVATSQQQQQATTATTKEVTAGKENGKQVNEGKGQSDDKKKVNGKDLLPKNKNNGLLEKKRTGKSRGQKVG